MRAAILLLVALALAAASGSAKEPPAVRALDDGSGGGAAYRFDPPLLTVAPGAEVVLVNEGVEPHTLTHDVRAAADRAFHSGTVAPGDRASLAAPQAPGEYGFHCVFHPEMTGTLVVAESAPPPDTRTPLPAWAVVGAAALASLLRRAARGTQ